MIFRILFTLIFISSTILAQFEHDLSGGYSGRGGNTDNVLQVSQGAFNQLPINIVSNLNQTATQLKKEDFWITAVENGIQSKNWYEIDFKGKMLIIVGSEGRGIKKLNLENSDFQTTIPMQGEINSLNVSAAVSAILFERLRQLSI